MLRFRLFGIPIAADWWFLLGLVFLAQWAGGGRAGMIAAVAVGVLTIIHELGHALTARRFGCAVAIQLNLLQGWASYASPKPLSRGQRIAISLAGPFSQLAAVTPFLWLAHAQIAKALRAGDAQGFQLAGDFWQGLVWAGIVIGLLNLLPLWPLDGGHVVEQLLVGPLGERRARRTMAIGTLVACAMVLVFSVLAAGQGNVFSNERIRARGAVAAVLRSSFPSALWEQVRAFPGHLLSLPWLLLLFCGLNSFMLLKTIPAHDRVATWVDVEPGERQRANDAPDQAAVDAEAKGWISGTPGEFPRGWEPSPWLRAHLALAHGDYTGAQQAMADVTTGGRRHWVPPLPDRPEMAPLVAVIPDPLPIENAARAHEVLMVRVYHGPPDALLRLANSLYQASRDAEVLFTAAGGLARRGLADDAMAWLRRAALERPDPDRVARDPGLAPLHPRLDFQQLLANLRQPAAPI